MKSSVSKLATPLMTAFVLILALVGTPARTAFGWNIESECKDGFVGGTIEVPDAGSFEIYVLDHVHGDGWLEVPGSRTTISVAEGKTGLVHFGPLDVRAHRSGAFEMTFRQTAKPREEYPTFPVCDAPLPTATSTATSVPPTNTPSPSPTATATRVPVTTTSVPPTSTPTRSQKIDTPMAMSPVPTRPAPVTSAPPVIRLPHAGTGNGEGKRHVNLYWVGAFASLFVGVGFTLRRLRRR